MTRRRNLTAFPAIVVTPLAPLEPLGPSWQPGAPCYQDAIADFPFIAANVGDSGWLEGMSRTTQPGRPFECELAFRQPRRYRLTPVTAAGYGPNPFPFPELSQAVAEFAGRRRFQRWNEDGPWDSLSHWESHDMACCLPPPGSMGSALARLYCEERTRQVEADNTPWRALRGLADAGDADLYKELLRERVTVFLGWPAYLSIVSAGPGARACPECGSLVTPGRTYCADAECQRARDRQRKRDSRAYAATPSTRYGSTTDHQPRNRPLIVKP